MEEMEKLEKKLLENNAEIDFVDEWGEMVDGYDEPGMLDYAFTYYQESQDKNEGEGYRVAVYKQVMDRYGLYKSVKDESLTREVENWLYSQAA